MRSTIVHYKDGKPNYVEFLPDPPERTGNEKRVLYFLRSADEAGIKQHPQEQIKDLGLHCFEFTGHPIGDCVEILLDRLPDPMPSYMKEIFAPLH